MTAVPVAILIERLARALQNEAHAGGLKPTQWEALRYLARANGFSRTPSALTAYLGTTKGTVSQTLQALERKGLIEKRSSAEDKRAVNLAVTAAGAALLAEDPLGKLDRAFRELPNAERAILQSAVQGLVKRLLAQRNGRSFGICRTCRYFRRDHQEGAPHFCSLLSEPLSDEDSEDICIEQEEVA